MSDASDTAAWRVSPSAITSTDPGSRAAIAAHVSTDCGPAMIVRTPQSRKRNSSSGSLNAGLSGTATAPARRIARKPIAKAGTFGRTSATRSPGSTPRSISAAARRSTRPRSSA